MFPKDPSNNDLDPCVALDMQLCGKGRPACEIHYFMSQSIEPDWDTDQRLLKNYYDAFIKVGEAAGTVDSVAYPFEQFREDVFIALVDNYLNALATMAGNALTPDSLKKMQADTKQSDLVTGVCTVYSYCARRMAAWYQHYPEWFGSDTSKSLAARKRPSQPQTAAPTQVVPYVGVAEEAQ